MIRYLLQCACVFLLSLSLCAPVLPQSIPFPGPGGVAGSAAVKAVAFVTQTSDGLSNAVHTFIGVNIGTASSDRCVIVGSIATNGGGTQLAGTIGGNAASIIDTANPQGNVGSGLMGLLVTTGTTATITVTYSASAAGMLIGVWALTGTAANCTPNAHGTSGASPPSVGLAALAGGTAIGIVGSNGSSGVTWTGLGTKDFDVTDAGGRFDSGASQNATSSGTLTITATIGGGSTSRSMTAATW